MEPLSFAGYLVFLICAMADGVRCLKERNDITNYWSTNG